MYKIRVLVADDHQQMLEYVCGLLSADCCEVVDAVTNGQAALDAALKLRPDVVVLDISMPVMNVPRRPSNWCLRLCVETTLGHRPNSSHQLGSLGSTLCLQRLRVVVFARRYSICRLSLSKLVVLPVLSAREPG